jgi:hypothetical protein
VYTYYVYTAEHHREECAARRAISLSLRQDSLFSSPRSFGRFFRTIYHQSSESLAALFCLFLKISVVR